MTVRFN